MKIKSSLMVFAFTVAYSSGAVSDDLDWTKIKPLPGAFERPKPSVIDTHSSFKFQRFLKLIQHGGRAVETDNWNCVADRKTGLTWERKGYADEPVADANQRPVDAKYTNTTGVPIEEVTARGNCVYQRIQGNDGVYRWVLVEADVCHTEGYAQHMNDENFCGYNDWRLPSQAELESILNNKVPAPHFVDREAFPYQWRALWTSTGTSSTDTAIQLHLNNQATISPVTQFRRVPTWVLLVRGTQR